MTHCQTPDCPNDAVSGSDFCKEHSLTTRPIRYVAPKRATKKAAKKAPAKRKHSSKKTAKKAKKAAKKKG